MNALYSWVIILHEYSAKQTRASIFTFFKHSIYLSCNFVQVINMYTHSPCISMLYPTFFYFWFSNLNTLDAAIVERDPPENVFLSKALVTAKGSLVNLTCETEGNPFPKAYLQNVVSLSSKQWMNVSVVDKRYTRNKNSMIWYFSYNFTHMAPRTMRCVAFNGIGQPSYSSPFQIQIMS